MRTIAIANQKGGCGKTTVVINLAACLAREGQRTLAIDLDPQSHCALGLAVPEEQIEVNIADVLLAEPGSNHDLSRVTWQISSNFDLVPSRTELSTLEQRLAGVKGRELRLAEALEAVRDQYDYVLIDSPPTTGFLTQNALMAADEVVVPVDTGYFSLHGLSKQLETIRAIRETYGRAVTVRVLANLYDVRTKLGREILAELRKRHGDAMFTNFINFNTKLKESTSLGQPITEYDPASIGCRDFVKLAREIIALSPSKPILVSPEPIMAEASATASATAPTMAPVATVAPVQQPAQQNETLMDRANALAEDANRLLATTEALIGSGRETPSIPAQPTAEATQRKIEVLYGPQPREDGMLFVVKAEGAEAVRLAGDFNGWNPEQTPMQRLNGDSFQVKLPLAPGRYCYRFVVDGSWLCDPVNEAVETNPFGELNSIVEVG